MQMKQDHLESLVQQLLVFCNALSYWRSFGQHSFGSIFVLATFEDLVSRKQSNEIFTYLTKKFREAQHNE